MTSGFRQEFCVVKRSGKREPFDIGKIEDRLRVATSKAHCEATVDLALMLSNVSRGLTTSDTPALQLENHVAETVASMVTDHPNHARVASAVLAIGMHKHCPPLFSEAVEKMYDRIDPSSGRWCPLVSDALYQVVQRHKDEIDAKIDPERDFQYDFFGFRTLQKSYLLTLSKNQWAETPQYMLMRVALGLHCVRSIVNESKPFLPQETEEVEVGTEPSPRYPKSERDHYLPSDDQTSNYMGDRKDPSMKFNLAPILKRADLMMAFETYDMMSSLLFTHASPTLFHSGTPRCQLSSCFLLSMKDDSLDGIYDTLREIAMINKGAGGVGLQVNAIRSTDSLIAGTNGSSNGVLPMLKVFDASVRYVDQGGSKRPGACAVYLEPWHADIFDFVSLRRPGGHDDKRTRNLFLGLWIPDLFMERVCRDQDWTLFNPSTAPGLHTVWGEEFNGLYVKYEEEGRGVRKVPARKLWMHILDAQIESGQPYMLFKDKCNEKSNQKNLGTIKCSNLCTEIIQYCSPTETACCNLASISIPAFYDKKTRSYDHQRLSKVTRTITRNLEKVIQLNAYPVETARLSNLRHRPMGIGVQGSADLFAIMRVPFDSSQARDLNREIFETIYFSAVSESCEMAKQMGPYSSFKGSPMSKGIFQFDMWRPEQVRHSGRWDWEKLRADVVEHGVRNSLFVAPMPTATTSQVLSNNECFEPFTSNCFARRVGAGDYVVINRYLVEDLVELGLWNSNAREHIIRNEGSIQQLPGVPEELKEVYRTVWEIKQKSIVEMAVDRAVYVDQNMSLNIHLSHPTQDQLNTIHFYAWRSGLKSSMYYLRSRPASKPAQFTLPPVVNAVHRPKRKRQEEEEEEMPPPKRIVTPMVCTDDVCISCHS